MDLSLIVSVAIAVVIVGGILMLIKIAPVDETAKRIGTIVILIIAVLWALIQIKHMAGG